MASLNPVQILVSALEIANAALEAAHANYQVEVTDKAGQAISLTEESVQPKEPIFLQLLLQSGTTPIGITHLVHVGGADWDNQPYEEIARTADEVAQAILNRVKLYFDSKEKGYYIDLFGTIFDFKDIEVCIEENHTFSIDGTPVTFNDSPLTLTCVKSEGIIEFIRQPNAHIELFDAMDQREGKGIFIDTDGHVYRG